MARQMYDTTLDQYGLRRVDPDGHPLYWHQPDATRNYARNGATGGICTIGDVWDQDAARSSKARPGRLRPSSKAPSPLLDGLGRITGTWTVIPGRERTWRLVARCRRGDVLAEPLPDFHYDEQSAEDYLARLVYPALELHGWSWQERIECPTHRAERLAVEAALEALRRQEAAQDVQAGRDGALPPAAAPVARPPAAAPRELAGGLP